MLQAVLTLLATQSFFSLQVDKLPIRHCVPSVKALSSRRHINQQGIRKDIHGPNHRFLPYRAGRLDQLPPIRAPSPCAKEVTQRIFQKQNCQHMQ